MKFSIKHFASIAIVGALSAANPAHSATISTLFNTGVDSSGAVLADGTVGDPHYTLTSVPSGSSTLLVRAAAGGFPIPPYLGDNTLSRWIGPNNDAQLRGPGGTYVYHTTFDLTGLNASTASITGQWATDNAGVDILINGTTLGYTTSITSFLDGFSAFTINSGFVAGVNTLDFKVSNIDGPTALRVELSGTASPVPVPSAVWLFGSGLLAAVGSITRRKAK